jgi:uncharacterized alpha-E superfamily protein
MGAFRATRQEITARTVTSFLLFSPDFPRSVRYCIDQVDAALHRISGTSRGTYSNESERECGMMLCKLNFGKPEDVLEEGLHLFLDEIQAKLNKIAEEIFETYVLMPERIVTKLPEAPSLSAIQPIQEQVQ